MTYYFHDSERSESRWITALRKKYGAIFYGGTQAHDAYCSNYNSNMTIKAILLQNLHQAAAHPLNPVQIILGDHLREAQLYHFNNKKHKKSIQPPLIIQIHLVL